MEIKKLKVDNIDVNVFNSRRDMGQIAAEHVGELIHYTMQKQDEVNMVFAAAPSQNEFIEALMVLEGIPWERINAFHMDEYIGLNPNAPQRFGQFLKTRLFDQLNFKKVHYLDPQFPEDECQRYTGLLQKHPSDIVCLGIGENGHLAFNDPPVADFNDPELVKVVELDQQCRQQQVNDNCFASLGDVPKTAITLTIPALLSAKHICCVVPGKSKARAVQTALEGDILTFCPASILRSHTNTIMYLDQDAASMLSKKY